MSLSQAASKVDASLDREKASTAQNTNPTNDRKFADDSGATMKALVWKGKNSVKVITAPKPKLVEATDAIVRVTGTTVCGSDLHLFRGKVVTMSADEILGHEFCGVVESVGEGVKSLAVGSRVVCSFQIACGQCLYCAKGLSSMCETTNTDPLQRKMYGENIAAICGYSKMTGGLAGGQAEFVRVAMAENNLLKIPDNIPDEKALYLSDTLSTAYHAVVDTGVNEGDVVAIWGAGPIGQMAAEYSLIKKAKRVIVIDGGTAAWRLKFVKDKLPQVETLNFTDVEAGKINLYRDSKGKPLTTVSEVLKKMEHAGPDVAIECAAGEYAKGWGHTIELALGLETDTCEIINEMIKSVKCFGRVGLTGVYVGFTNHFNVGSLMQRGVKLMGNGQAPVHKYWHDLLKMIADESLDPRKMVSHRFRLDDIAEVYKKLDAQEVGMQKVFIETQFSNPRAEGTPELSRPSRL